MSDISGSPRPAARCSRLGLIVNPVAGLGGRVGLKGSDGDDVQARARGLGGTPEAGRRAALALEALKPFADRMEVITCPGEMGEDVCRDAGLAATVIGLVPPGRTTAADTRGAARAMQALGVDLLLFAGGDGTARDVCEAIGVSLPVLGIPAGVKMHSAVFSVHAREAGEIAIAFLQATRPRCREGEVMDLDEEGYRVGRVSARLYGYLRVPVEETRVQERKAPTPLSDAAAADEISRDVIEGMEAGRLYILGPGTTTRAIAVGLGIAKTLVGVDVARDGRLVAADVSDRELRQLVADREASIVVSPIGGQGFLFGRGNQQITPEVIRSVGKNRIVVVSTQGKLHSLQGRPFLVDTGSAEVDALLAGHIRVITGYRERMVYRIEG